MSMRAMCMYLPLRHRVASALLGCAAALLGAIAAPTVAHAQDMELLPRPKTPAALPSFAFELRFSPYAPRVDSEPALGGNTPYANSFGTMSRLLGQAEFDWQALKSDSLGSLGLGLAVGYTEMTGNAFQAGTTTASREETTLAIMPGYLVAVGRFDLLARRYKIPFVPFAKAGLGYGYWRASTSDGLSQANGKSGTGLSLGLHVAGGIAFELDWLDRESARSLANGGIKHSYLYAEYFSSQLGLAGSPLRVGANAFSFGFAFAL
jgi:hypothetical protein